MGSKKTRLELKQEAVGKFGLDHIGPILSQIEHRKELLSEFKKEFSQRYITKRGKEKFKSVNKKFTDTRRLALSVLRMSRQSEIVKGEVLLLILQLGYCIAEVDRLVTDFPSYISSSVAGSKPGRRLKIPQDYQIDILNELLSKTSTSGQISLIEKSPKKRRATLAPFLHNQWESRPLPIGVKKLPALKTIKSWIRHFQEAAKKTS